MYEKVQRGQYLVGDREYYFRSKWEANYALYLEFLKQNGEIIEWEYEPQTFNFPEIKHGVTRYIPDFRITEKNGQKRMKEVKGYMDRRSQTKINRFRKYYPQLPLDLVDGAFMRDLTKKWGRLLKFY